MNGMNDIFDDSDDSDDEAAQPMPESQPPQQPSSNVTNSALFGSDSDDSDDDEEKPAPASESNEAKEDNPADDDADENADGNTNTTEKEATNSDEDSDVEFDNDGITGKKARPTRSSLAKAQKEKPKLISVPDIPLPHFQKENVTLHMAQLPKVLGIQSEAYDANTYNASVEDAEFQGTGNSMIRWRYKVDESGDFVRDAEGRLVRESNAKIIKWSDGSYGLRVGDEIFDIDEIGNSTKKSSEEVNSEAKDFLYLTQKARSEEGERKSAGTILECVNSLKSKFLLRPASIKSGTHRIATMKKQRTQLKQRPQIQEHVTFVDPEKQKAERIQNKEDLMKQEKRSGGRRSTGGGGKRRYGMHRAYMEEDDEHYDSVNIRSLKKRKDDMDYDDYGDDEEDEWSKQKKRGFEDGRKTAKYLSDEEDADDEDMVLDNEDDDEEEIVNRKTASRGGGQKRRAAFLDDDDDSE